MTSLAEGQEMGVQSTRERTEAVKPVVKCIDILTTGCTTGCTDGYTNGL